MKRFLLRRVLLAQGGATLGAALWTKADSVTSFDNLIIKPL